MAQNPEQLFAAGSPVPAASGSSPAIPLPSPEQGRPIPGPPPEDESAPVLPPGVLLPGRPRRASVRFLNAAAGYPPLRIFLEHRRAAGMLSFASITAYTTVAARYYTVTVSGTDGSIYLQRSLLLEEGNAFTIAVVNRPGGLDLLQIHDLLRAPADGSSNFRVGNLALRSGPMDVLLGDGRTIYADLRFKEVTPFKKIRPGAYQFFFAETGFLPIPEEMDIESLDSAFLGLQADPGQALSLYAEIQRGANYTVYLLNAAPHSAQLQTVLIEDR